MSAGARMFTVILLLFVVGAVHGGEPEYRELDRGIVNAFNRNPRDGRDVYSKALRIFRMAAKDESDSGKAWSLKARKLITVACFQECTRLVGRRLYRDAYVWARRGELQGTDMGRIGETELKKLHSYLCFAAGELEKTPMVKDSNPELLSRQIEGEALAWFSEYSYYYGVM